MNGARSAWLVIAFAQALILGHSVQAQPSAALPLVQYEAPSTCPRRDVFVERVRARLFVDGTRVPADMALRVTLAARGAGTHGIVELQRGATKTQRSVDAGRCEEVVEALALITALALSEHDPRATNETRKRTRKADKTDPAPGQGSATTQRVATSAATPGRVTDPAARGASPGQGAAAQRGAAAATGKGAAAAQRSAAATTGQGAAEVQRGATSDQEADAAERSAPSEQVDDAAARDATKDQEADAAERGSAVDTGSREAAASAPGLSPEDRSDAVDPPWQPGAELGAAFVLFSGLAPGLQPGLQLRAAFTLNGDAFAWSLQLGARIARRDRLVSADGDAWFGFAGGVVRVCGSSLLGSTPVALSGCAVAEPGVFSTGAENTENPRSHTRLWLALGAAAEASVRLTTWLNLRAGAELLAPLRRDRMSLAGDTLYRTPALGLRLQLGLEVPFG